MTTPTPFRIELPLEAGHESRHGFDVNEEWFKAASPDLQLVAMETWFLKRYQAPTIGATSDLKAKKDIYKNGGPYQALTEIELRFKDIASGELIKKAASYIDLSGIKDWTPVMKEPDFFWYLFESHIDQRRASYDLLLDRIENVDRLLKIQVHAPDQQPLFQLLYISLIITLEVYLEETIKYWIFGEDSFKDKFVLKYNEISKENRTKKIQESEGIEQRILEAVSNQVWHKLSCTIPLLCSTLEIPPPPYQELDKAVDIRNDITHRGGKNKSGEPLTVTINDIRDLSKHLRDFADYVYSTSNQKYPFEESATQDS